MERLYPYILIILLAGTIVTLFYVCYKEVQNKTERCEAKNGFYIQSQGICVPKDNIIFEAIIKTLALHLRL